MGWFQLGHTRPSVAEICFFLGPYFEEGGLEGTLAASAKGSRSLEGEQAVLKYGIGQIADICKTM